MGLSKQETLQLRSALQDAVVKCSERCLYHSAKWAAELLTSIPDIPSDQPPSTAPLLFTQNVDPAEARLEAAEINKYLLAKTFFDCREYDRCAAVFLPDSLMSGVLAAYHQDHPERAASTDLGFSELPSVWKEQQRMPHHTTAPHQPSKPGHRHGSSGGRRPGGRKGSGMSFGKSHTSVRSDDTDDIGVEIDIDAERAAEAEAEAVTARHLGVGQMDGVIGAGDDGDKEENEDDGPLETDPVRTLPELSQKSLFLALYAKLISGEKKKDEEVEMVMGPHDTGNVSNRQLPVISAYLQTWFGQNLDEDEERVVSQGWLEYLFGMVLAKEKNEKEAMEWFIRSVHRFPMNWGCWLEMTNLVSRVDELNKIAPRLPQNIVSFLFHLHASLELYQQGHNLAASLDQLLAIFPSSAFLLTCNALLAYHSKDLLAAEQHFSTVLAQHPHRLDSLDHYSNILYVLNLRPKLAFLAHLCSSLDKFRPETCVVIGNYYSLMSSHEKAVQYFKRALHLDRSCLSAWTLMGHEYVELKNTHAAIESYRRAVDVNRRDYRAWYGLGQTYEVLEMHTYALWYYKRAAGLRPWDGKMWMAVGSCLQKMGCHRDGIKALKRALYADANYEGTGNAGGGGGRGGLGAASAAGMAATQQQQQQGYMDPEVLLQIALMYEQLGDQDEAKSYMELCMAQEEGEPEPNLGNSVATMYGRDYDDNDDDFGGSARRDSEGGGGGGVYGDPADDGPDGPGGTGVTPATSKARLWLARYSLAEGEYAAAARLAAELVQDGVDVEEAKALQRDAQTALEQQQQALGQGPAAVGS